METSNTQVDVRKYGPKDKHPMIFQTFTQLEPGKTMEIINDHDPRPLHYQFMHEHPDEFTWQYLEEGPDVWRVAITKIQTH